MIFQFLLSTLIGCSVSVHAAKFPFEDITLSDSDIKTDLTISFGNLSTPLKASSRPCKVFPGDERWPSDCIWTQFNSTLGGVLIKGVPPAIVCYKESYDGAKCASMVAKYFDEPLRQDDPVTIENEWLDGDSCPAQVYNNIAGVNSTIPVCNVDAYPAYVVNVTTVKRKT